MYSKVKKVGTVLMAMTLVFMMSACESMPTAQKEEIKTQQSNYERLVAKEPAHRTTNPQTRETVNFWVDTWNKEGQLAYVYLQNSKGNMIGYFVLDGPPVSMCTMLTPNYRIVDRADGDVVVPAPGIDGVYRSGGNCSTYYGKDAVTGAFVEFTVGLGINMLLYTQPLPNHPNVENLSPGKKKEDE